MPVSHHLPMFSPCLQAMDSPYANGAFSPPYPPYSSLPQPRGFYCSGPPEPTPGWSYGGLGVSPECPPEGSALRRQHGPGYSPPQVTGLGVGTGVVPSGYRGGGSGPVMGGKRLWYSWGVSLALEHLVLPGFILTRAGGHLVFWRS